MRHDRVRGALGNRARRVAGGDLHRNGIRLRGSVQVVYLNKQKSCAVASGRNGKLLNHLEMAKTLRLGAKPARAANVIGQDFALEVFSLAITKQNVQLSWRFDRRHKPFLRYPAAVGRRLQREPIISVRAERDDVARFPDRPKQITAKDFHRHVAGEARKIQLRRLREPRKICHHYYGLFFPPAKKRQNLCIVGVEKFERAARKCLEIFPHGNDPA